MNSVQTYQLNNREVQVDLGEAPKISESSQKILQQELHLYIPKQLEGAELKSRISTLPNLMQEIQEVKDSKVKDRLLACLQALLVAASVAGIVFGIIYNSPFVVLAFLSFYVFSAWGIVDAAEKLGLNGSAQGGAELLGFCTVFGGGIFMPLYAAFSRVSHLEESLEERKQSIKEDLDQAHAANLQLLPENHCFYQQETRRIQAELDRRIEESETSLQALQQVAVRSSKGEEELNARIAALRATQENWTQVVEFYNQFNA